MDERIWAEFLSALMQYASKIFSSIGDFKNGKLTVEAEGRATLKITIWKNNKGELRLHFEFSPSVNTESIVGQKQVEEAKIETSSPVVKEGSSIEVSKEELEELEGFFKRMEEIK